LPITGAYEIQSLGQVFQPSAGLDIFAPGVTNMVVAEKSITAEVKLWDGLLVTSQRDFYGNTADTLADFGSVTVGNETRYNKQTESYPEIDTGPVSEPSAAANDVGQSTRYSGYVGLSTYGGSYHALTGTKARNAYVTSSPSDYAGVTGVPTGTAYYTAVAEKMHAHWDADCFMHWHKDSSFTLTGMSATTAGAPCGRWVLFLPAHPNLELYYNGGTSGYQKDGRFTMAYNNPDKPESLAGPYAPPDNIVTHRYRQCRSFTLPPSGTFTWPVTNYAPTDLRVDGFYAEKGSSAGYLMTDMEAFHNNMTGTQIANSSWRFNEGTISFWLKPNWFPECTGKARALFSAARYRYHMHAYTNGVGWGYIGGRCHHGTGFTNPNCPCGYSESTTWGHCNGAHATNAWDANFNPFTLYYVPAHANASGGTGANDVDYPTKTSLSYSYDIGKLRPASFGFGMGIGARSGADNIQWPMYGLWPGGADDNSTSTKYSYANLHVACVTPSLNHGGHGSPISGNPLVGEDGKFNRLRGHEWTHVIATWKMPAINSSISNFEPIFGSAEMQMYVNGEAYSMAFNDNYAGDPGWTRKRQTQWWLIPYGLINTNTNITGGTKMSGTAMETSGNTTINFWGGNTIRIGGETDGLSPLDTVLPWKNGVGQTGGNPLPRMWTADATFDEFFLWTERTTAVVTDEAINNQWARGRYYRPDDATATSGIYTSKRVTLTSSGSVARALPPQFEPPPAPTPEGGGGGDGTDVAPPSGGAGGVRIMGLSWTCYAETYETPAGQPASMRSPAMRDWATIPPTISFPAPTADVNGFKNSSVVDLYVSPDDGVTWLGLNNPALVRFRAKFRVGPATRLLSTPVLDDVTIIFDNGTPTFLSCMLETIK
jgi:hypothetical protein